MTETVTLAQVEALAARLPLTEHLQLVAHVCEQLSVVFLASSQSERQASNEGKKSKGTSSS